MGDIYIYILLIKSWEEYKTGVPSTNTHALFTAKVCPLFGIFVSLRKRAPERMHETNVRCVEIIQIYTRGQLQKVALVAVKLTKETRRGKRYRSVDDGWKSRLRARKALD